MREFGNLVFCHDHRTTEGEGIEGLASKAMLAVLLQLPVARWRHHGRLCSGDGVPCGPAPIDAGRVCRGDHQFRLVITFLAHAARTIAASWLVSAC